MKKGVKIAIIVVAIVLVLAIIAVAAFVLLNKEKPSIKPDEFKSIMEEKGYTIVNALTQFAGVNEISAAYLALDGDMNYQIEFYELSDEQTAAKFYNSNQSSFEESKGNASVETKVNGKNYAKYTLSSNGEYMVISRIDNTAVFVSVESEYKDEVQKVLKDIGY